MHLSSGGIHQLHLLPVLAVGVLLASFTAGCPIWSRYMNSYGMPPYGGYGYYGGMGMAPGMYGAGMGMGMPGYGYGMGGMTAGSPQYPYVDPQVYWLLAEATPALRTSSPGLLPLFLALLSLTLAAQMSTYTVL
ncbi:uncharacterized protein LOC129587354 [Paramacrobiotus metropolitanus]|uniref:uncharacterized protein LOC129587354 n=1 Tax=Paramacrobiotus metropolitanus TaxID=2943436 RepID=UPI0024461BF3|nr:uncharacterized protein LOC129587354 [Paramacrobiotus metropolitanus]